MDIKDTEEYKSTVALLDKITLKQETLEEVAEKYAEGKSSNPTFRNTHIRDFKAGADWQSERMYSDEEVLKAQQAILCNIKDALMNENYIIEYIEQFKKK